MAGASRDYKNAEQTREDFKNQKSRILISGGECSVAASLQRRRDNGWENHKMLRTMCLFAAQELLQNREPSSSASIVTRL